ncbi:MAG: long-chain-fatty acid transport protein [Rhodocyclales bacterium]|nr:long-chain-fatty acid transport protein [Rhodocyclales bacterium]
MMKHAKQQKMIVQSVVAALALMAAGSATASGFQLLEQNGSGLGNAYAGSAAVSENASTIFFNPAGMTQLPGAQISLGANAVRPSFKFSNGNSANPPAATGSNGGDAGGWSAIPNFYTSAALNKDWYIGVGIGAPFGLKTEYDADWAGRFQSTKFEIKTININPSLAYRVNDKLSLGGGLNWQRLDATYERYAAVGVPPFSSPALNAAAQNTLIQLKVGDDGFGWNIGALLKPSDSMKIGMSYRSQIKYDLTGNLTSTNQAISPNTGAKAKITMPDTFVTSVTQKLDDKWEMLGDISWTGWHKIQDVDIYRSTGGAPAQTLNARFRNTWRVALGANYQLNDAWKIKTGVAYDQTPVRSADQRLTSLPDNNRIWFSAGTQWKPTKTATVDVGASYLYIKKTSIHNDQTASGRGLVDGTYKGSVFILGAQYSQAF